MSRFILFCSISIPQDLAVLPTITPQGTVLDLSKGWQRVMLGVAVFLTMLVVVRMVRMARLRRLTDNETPAEALRKESTVHNGLGEDLLAQGNTLAAIGEFSSAIRRDPTNGESWRNRGLARLQQADFRRAKADFEEALSLLPGCEVSKGGLEMAESST